MNDKINILVVEDDEDINNLLCKILEGSGYNVRSAYSGSEGKMCIEQYDCILYILHYYKVIQEEQELI